MGLLPRFLLLLFATHCRSNSCCIRLEQHSRGIAASGATRGPHSATNASIVDCVDTKLESAAACTPSHASCCIQYRLKPGTVSDRGIRAALTLPEEDSIWQPAVQRPLRCACRTPQTQRQCAELQRRQNVSWQVLKPQSKPALIAMPSQLLRLRRSKKRQYGIRSHMLPVDPPPQTSADWGSPRGGGPPHLCWARDIWQPRTLALDLWLPQSYQATLLLTHWLSPLRLPCLRSRRPAALEYDHESRVWSTTTTPVHIFAASSGCSNDDDQRADSSFSIGMPSPLGLHYDAVNARYRYKPGLGTSSILTSSSSSRNWSQGALPTRYDRTCCWLLENTLHERSHRQTQHCRVLPLLPDWAPVFPLSTAGGDVRPVLLICDACLRRSPCCAGFSILCTARPGSRRSFDDSRRVDRPSIEAEHIVATMVLCLSRKPSATTGQYIIEHVTWNAGGLSMANLDELFVWLQLDDLHLRPVHLMSIQETHWTFASEWQAQGY